MKIINLKLLLIFTIILINCNIFSMNSNIINYLQKQYIFYKYKENSYQKIFSKAILAQDIETIKTCIENNVDINCLLEDPSNQIKKTALIEVIDGLYWTGSRKCIEIINLLINDKNIDLNKDFYENNNIVTKIIHYSSKDRLERNYIKDYNFQLLRNILINKNLKVINKKYLNDPLFNALSFELSEDIINLIINHPNFDLPINFLYKYFKFFYEENKNNLKYLDQIIENKKFNFNQKKESNEKLSSYIKDIKKKDKKKFINKINEVYNFFKEKVYQAIKDNDYNTLKYYLLKLGSVCFKDKDGNNILHYAMKSGNLDFIKLLIYLKPDLIWQTNNSGQTPLSFMLANYETYKLIKSLFL